MNVLVLQRRVCFFGSVVTFWDSKNALIFKINIFFDRKVNLVGTSGESGVKSCKYFS